MSVLGEVSARPLPTAGDPRVPAHVAIIMDGNGRWAKAHGLPRAAGHRKGVESLRRTVRHAAKLGVGYLTVFSFSSENWSRPAQEVASLIGLLRRFIEQDLIELHEANVRVRPIGRRDDLSAEINALLRKAEDTTRANTGLTLLVAFNYGGRDEIVRACQALAERVKAGPGGHRRGDAGVAPRHRRHPRPGSDHPHQWREPPVELHHVAGSLFGVRVRARALA